MADNIPLSFLVGLNIDDLKAKAEEGKKKFEELGRHAEKEGAYIDALFQHLGKGFDVSTIEGRMNALRNAISDNNLTLRQWGESVERWGKQADKAFAKGDYDLFNTINKDIEQTTGDIKDLEAETEYLTKLLKQMEESVGQVSQSGMSAPRLFINEEDYQHVKDLEQAINDLFTKLEQAGTDTEFTTINAQIIELQQQLSAANQKATEAAASLGDNLGTKAADSSTRLYELNATLKEQQKTYDDLVAKLEDVAQKMDAATAAGDTAQLKDLQLEYQHLAEHVQNANDALQQTKGEQKDAEENWKGMLDTISSLSDEVQQSTRPVGQAITSFTQLSAAFKNSKNPVQTFRATLQALRGGMSLTQISVKGVISGLKALWKALLSNPITAILVAITALVAAFVSIANSIKSVAEKQAQLNAAEKVHLDLLKQITENSDRGYDQAIQAKERELKILKAGNSSLSAQYKLEDEILRLKKEKAEKAKELWKEETANIDQTTKALERQQKALAALELRSSDGGDLTWKQVNRRMAEQGMNVEYRRSGFLGWGRKELYVDGVRVSKGATEDMIKDVQGQLDNSKTKVEMGVKVEADVEDAKAAIEEAARQRAEKYKQIAKTETDAIRAATGANNALISDAYQREIAVARTASSNKIADLKRRLSEEADLTARARLAINQQILAEEKSLQQKLQTLDMAHQAKMLAIRRQVEDVSVDSGAKTADEQRAALLQKYSRMYEDTITKIDTGRTNGTLSEDEITELYNLAMAYRKRYGAESAILNLQIQQQDIETAKEGINLRLAAVKEGTMEELQLRLQLLEQEHRAEIQANKLLPDDQRQSEDEINAKYRKQREDEEKAFYASVIGDYADYQQEMLNMTTAFETRRAELEQQIAQERDPKKKQALRKSLSDLERTYRASLKSLQQEFIKNNIGDVFNEQTVENIKEAKRALDEMEGMSVDDFNLAYQAHLSAEEFESLKQRIREVRNELRDMGKGYSLKDAFSDAFTGKTKDEVQRGVDYIVSGFSKVASVASGIASAMREFAEATGNAKLEKMADTFQGIADTISTAGGYAAAGAQIGGGWGAIIGAVVGIGQGVITAIFKSEAQKEEAERVRAEEAHDYLREVVSGIGSLIGSVNNLGDTIAGLDYSNYRKSLLDAINSIRKDGTFDSSGNWNSLRSGADSSSAFGQLDARHLAALFDQMGGTVQSHVQWGSAWTGEGADYERWARAMELYANALSDNGLSDEELEEFKRIISSMSGYGGGHTSNWIKREWADQENHKDYELDERRKRLMEELNRLYKEGSLNSTEYFNLLMQADKLSLDMLQQKKRELLGQGFALDSDEVIEIQNQIDELEYNMGERVRKMFEGLAGTDLQSIVNKWLDIFKEFGDNFDGAIEKINESINDMIRNMVVQTVFVQPLMQRLNKYLQDYAKNANLEQDEEGNYIWTNEAFRGMAEGLRTQVEGAKELYQSLMGELNAAGLGWGDAANDRSAQARGIATASQESVDELNGRMTTVQGHTFIISENSNIIRDNTNAILGSVRQIEFNTQHLVRIDDDLHRLHSSLESIITINGIKIRS